MRVGPFRYHFKVNRGEQRVVLMPWGKVEENVSKAKILKMKKGNS